jgi:hypothetical protein
MELWQRPRLPTNDRPTLSPERAPQEDKDSNSHYIGLKSGHESQRGLDTKTDWLADRQSQHDSDSESHGVGRFNWRDTIYETGDLWLASVWSKM